MVDIIIPLYICDQSLYPIVDRCFEAIGEIKGNYSLLVVDDASPFEHYFPVDIQNKENLGFTATVNKGLRASTADVVVVMNDDVTLTQECFDRFAAMTGCQIASPMDTAASTDDRFGSCWAITREALNKLGYLNEEYRNYWSDMDYYQRAKEAGIDVIKWNSIILEHPESSTFKTLDKDKLLAADTEKWQRNIK